VTPSQEPTPGSGPTIGVIGLGAIGDGVAKSVHGAGLPLVVCDIMPEAMERHAAYATVAASPALVARDADVVIVAVVDDAQVHAVLSGPDGALAAGGHDTTFIVVSTITSACIRAIGAEAEAADTSIIDCGVSGGPSAAATGELICMVGGDEDVLERLAPVFDALGSLTVHMGPFGTGLAAKLARNLVQYGGWLAAYEGQVLAEAAGIELSKLAQVIKASDAKIGGASTLMFRSTVAPFTDADDAGLIGAMRNGADLAHKDLMAALALAGELDVDLPLAAMTEARTADIFGVGGLTEERGATVPQW
jgi:3-hydroxyisobutyrate dehydrogenase-like beta-hydroxyacid dehydrogenase